MFNYDISPGSNYSGYSWNRKNGQDIPVNHNMMQHVKHVDIIMMESPISKQKSVLISLSEAAVTEKWTTRNKTFVADIGTNWYASESLKDVTFSKSAGIKSENVYVIKTNDYYIKLCLESVEEIVFFLP